MGNHDRVLRSHMICLTYIFLKSLCFSEKETASLFFRRGRGVAWVEAERPVKIPLQ